MPIHHTENQIIALFNLRGIIDDIDNAISRDPQMNQTYGAILTLLKEAHDQIWNYSDPIPILESLKNAANGRLALTIDLILSAVTGTLSPYWYVDEGTGMIEFNPSLPR